MFFLEYVLCVEKIENSVYPLKLIVDLIRSFREATLRRAEMSLYEATCYRDFITKIYNDIRIKNPSYSLRSFARRLGTSASLISNIFNKKDSLTPAMAERILSHLNIGRDEANFFRELLKAEDTKDFRTVEKLREIHRYQLQTLLLDEDLSTEDFAVFVKVSLHESISLAEGLSTTTGCSDELLRASCKRLVAAGLLAGCEKNGWISQRQHVQTSDEQAIYNRKIHVQTMMLISDALVKMKTDERFLFSTYQSLCEEDFQKLRLTIADFLTSPTLSSQAESLHRKAYMISAQLIPL